MPNPVMPSQALDFFLGSAREDDSELYIKYKSTPNAMEKKNYCDPPPHCRKNYHSIPLVCYRSGRIRATAGIQLLNLVGNLLVGGA
jgi:hypothetical protein